MDFKLFTHNRVSTRLRQAVIMMAVILIGIIISISSNGNTISKEKVKDKKVSIKV